MSDTLRKSECPGKSTRDAGNATQAPSRKPKNGYRVTCFALLAALAVMCAALIVTVMQNRRLSSTLAISNWNESRTQSLLVTINGQVNFLQEQVKAIKGALGDAGLVVVIGSDPDTYHDPDCVKLDNRAAMPYRFMTLSNAQKLGLKPDSDCK